jgi:hypothetical protein
MTETIFTPDQFDRLIQMGSSSDTENQILALSLVETVDFKEHMVYILLLKKLSSINEVLWAEHAPKTYKQMSKAVNVKTILTYKKVFEALGNHKVSVEQMQFFLDYFGNYLKEQCKALGYDFIKDLEITIKT